jgi:rare lipoprotein A
VSFIAERKSRYLEPDARQPVAHVALPPSDFLRPAVPLVAGGLALIALVAIWQSTPAASNWVAPERMQQAMTVVTQTVNVATKGSRLETVAPVVAAPERERAKVKVASLTLDAISRDSEPDELSVKGKASYGLASYYWKGRKTASGERFDADALTAAHRTLPFGTRVRVTSLATGRSVTVRINDRGPFIRGRTVDISRAAAQSLGMIDRGVTKVKLDVLR